MKKYISYILIGLITILNVSAASVKLSWNPNPEPNIASYTLAYKAVGATQYIFTTVNHPATTVTISSLEDGVLYFFKVRATNSLGMTSEYSGEISYQIPIIQDPIVSIDNSKWKASATSSLDTVGNAIDKNIDTFWLATATLPQSFIVDLGGLVIINGVGYLPRQDKASNGGDLQAGRIRHFIIQTSVDGITWVLASQGEFSNNGQEKLVVFPEKTASFIKLIAGTDWLSGANGAAAISELKVIGNYAIPPSAPVNLRITN